jgi:hypothetical protein
MVGEINGPTMMTPLPFNVVVRHSKFGPKSGKMYAANAPEQLPDWNNLKLSPLVNAAAPMLITFSVPPSVKVPEIFTTSFVDCVLKFCC